uniref:Uncharacterized protein n=1 Tax=Arundo donax TaxID=35708 RepID=A0A0A8XTI7_ARUDO
MVLRTSAADYKKKGKNSSCYCFTPRAKQINCCCLTISGHKWSRASTQQHLGWSWGSGAGAWRRSRGSEVGARARWHAAAPEAELGRRSRGGEGGTRAGGMARSST